jgi:two-component system sensor histidine kinase HydH
MEPESQPHRWPMSARGRVLGAAAIGSLSVGTGALVAAQLGAPISGALGGSFVGVSVAAVFLWVARRLWDSEATPGPSAHKRALDQLSEELTSLASPGDVAGALERTIRRLLACDSIEFTFAPAETPQPAQKGSDRSGEHEIVTLARGKGEPYELAFPVEFHGVRLGRLKVGRAADGPRFSAAERELLRAIAHEGGLALAHAVAYSELEKRRKQQAAAWRDEREALVETLSAEIAHEVRYPINFFRTIFQRATGYRVLEEEDIEIGCEEVDRLERLVSGLRRMATQHLERRVVDVSELCSRTEVLLRDRMGGHPLILDLEEGGSINCDIDKVTQVLVNLLANALEATEGKGGVGVEWRWTPRGGQLSVWDTGPGFTGDPSRLFAPWYTTKPRGTGLGLAITYRLVRAHGWSIEAMRRDSKTVFVVAVPPNDILVHAAGSGSLPAGKKGEVA